MRPTEQEAKSLSSYSVPRRRGAPHPGGHTGGTGIGQEAEGGAGRSLHRGFLREGAGEAGEQASGGSGVHRLSASCLVPGPGWLGQGNGARE